MTLFDLFFTTQIPPEMRFRTFSAGHAVVFAAVALCIVWGTWAIRRRSPEQSRRAIVYLAWCLPVIYIVRFVVFALLDVLVEPQMPLADRLPLHLCPLNSVIMPIAVLTGNRTLLNYLYAISLPAAVAAMMTPAMSYYGLYAVFSWQVLFFFLDHGVMAAVSVFCVAGEYFRPDVHTLPRVAALFLGYCAVIYPINRLTGQNYLFLRHPDQGTIMALFARYLGNPGYLLPLAALAALLVALLYLPWFIADRNARQAL